MVAGSDFYATTDALLIQRLGRRFGLTEAVAAVIVALAFSERKGAVMTVDNFPGRCQPPPKLPPDAAEDLDWSGCVPESVFPQETSR